MSLDAALATLPFATLLQYAVRFAADRDRAELRLAAECGRAGPDGWVYDLSTGTWRAEAFGAVLARSAQGPTWEVTMHGRNRGGLGEIHALDLMLRVNAEHMGKVPHADVRVPG